MLRIVGFQYKPCAVKIWDVTTGQLRTVLPGTAPVQSLVFGPDGRTLLGAAHRVTTLGRDWGEIRLWDLTTGKVRLVPDGYSEPPASLAIAPDGKHWVACGWPRRIELRNPESDPVTTVKLFRVPAP